MVISLQGQSVIFGRPWWSEEVSEDYNKANVNPVFNKSKEEDPGNYSLISLILIPGKVMEQILLEAISKNTKGKKVIESGQHGFMEGRTCLTNLTTFHDEMTCLIEEGRAMAAMLTFVRLLTLSSITSL